MTENEIRNNVISIAKKYIGYKESDGSHKKIIDGYNSKKPLPRNYKVTYKDSWCATFVSFVGIKSGLSDIILKECSCGEMIKLYKKENRWIEDDSYVPNIADIIMYDWDDNGKGDCVGYPEHVGIVVSVNGDTIKVIEGNKNDSVSYRTLKINGKYIRGYCIPNYKSKSDSIENIINKTNSSKINKDIKWNGKVSASKLNVRTYAGTENKTVSFSPLKKGTSVGVCDTVKDSKGSDWYYIKYKDKYGFVSSKYVSKKENDTYLKKSSKFMKIIYDKVVSIKCTHKSGAKTYKEMVEKRETTCGRTVSFVFQEAGLLKTGMLISHTDAVGGGTSNILKKKNTISKAMKGYENLDLKKCKVVYLGEKNFDSVPSKYKVPGVAFIQDSNVFMCAGKDDGRYINYSCNNDTNKQVKKDKNGVYRYYNDKMKDGYTFTSPILVAIVPNN